MTQDLGRKHWPCHHASVNLLDSIGLQFNKILCVPNYWIPNYPWPLPTNTVQCNVDIIRQINEDEEDGLSEVIS